MARPTRSIHLRRTAGVLASLALGAGIIVAVAPAASAAGPVPYDVPFEAPAIPPGGFTEADLDCPDDAGASVPVSVEDPNGDTVVHSVTTAGPSTGSPGRMRIQVGTGGLFAASTLGTWTVTIDCPSYDPYVTTFEVITPTLGLVITPDRDFDCSTLDGPSRLRDTERMCWDIANDSGQDIRRYVMTSHRGAAFQYPAAGEFPTGTSLVLNYGTNEPLPAEGDDSGPLFVWAEIGTAGSGVFAVSPVRSHVWEVPGPAIGVQATTGLSPATACPEDGGLADRVVAPGTQVYFCYRLTNTSGFTFGHHTVTDDADGPLLDGLVDVLPDGSLDQLAPGPVTMTADGSRTVTWDILGRSSYGEIDDTITLTGTATASVTVTAVDPDPTTTTTTAIPTPTSTTAPVSSSTAPAAQAGVEAVATTPKLTG